MTTVGTIELIAKIDTSGYKKGATEIEHANKQIEGSVDKTDSVAKRTTKSMASLAVRGFKVATVAALALGTAIATMTLKGGIDRALNIEDAQAKLRGLGHDTASVATIMQNALDSVRGTSYGLDAAATTAANAVASGIKPGTQLAQVLKTVANTSALAGRDMSELGAIFNKVAASNKVQMDVINQLHDAGVPALALLAKEIGKTAEQTAEMASAGEINFETFERAMRKGVGNAAIEMGKTTRGSWANMKAAMSRVGAAIVKDIIPRIRDSIQGMTKWFDENSDNIVGAVGRTIDVIKKFASGVVDVANKVGDYLGPKLDTLWNTISTKVFPVLKKLWDDVLKPLVPVIGTALVLALGLAIDAFNVLLTVVTPVVNFLIDNKEFLYPIIAGFVTLKAAMMLQAAFTAVQAGFTTLTTTTIPAATARFAAFNTLLSTPMVMPAIIIAAALVAIAKVYSAYQDLKRETQQAESAIDSLNRSMDESIKKGKLTLDQAYKIQNSPGYTGNKTVYRQGSTYLPGFADGTMSAPGGMSWVGERGPELVNLPKGSQVIPNHDLDRVGSNITINLSGTFATSPAEQRKVAQQIADKLQEIQRARGFVGRMA